jgi:hypothetical protein
VPSSDACKDRWGTRARQLPVFDLLGGAYIVGKRVREAIEVATEVEAALAIEAFLLSLTECEAARLAGKMEEHFSLGGDVLESLSSWYMDSLLSRVRCQFVLRFL